MSQQAKGEWERAFAVCQKVSQTDSSDGPVGVARLTRQESVVVPPNSEMVLWTQLYGAETKSDFCALVEGPERDDEWQVARTVAWVVKGRLPIREGDQALVQVKEWVARGHFPLPEERKASQPAVKRLLREWSRLYIQEAENQERHTGLNLSQIVVPTGKTQELWEKYHQASGHMGIAKIDALLRKTFYWRVYKQVAARTKANRLRDKDRYDRKAKHLPLLPGERVLLRNFRRRGEGKLAPHWQPQLYVVHDQLRPGLPVFQIRPEGKEGPIKTIHRNHLRPCPFDPPEVPHHAPEIETNPIFPNLLLPRPLLLPLTLVPSNCSSYRSRKRGPCGPTRAEKCITPTKVSETKQG
ncbi:hypothetical protein F7725_011490 [Dissostichus mawsoni]|uniref:Integrase zinc-binding domain-containing protein n=1 Tax=Dissostichus mawsoni TaxID=36200 RepID=A0A7J5ZB62_DISMA|nr:hypothetical protein F7725_011490 [Dissostichus mawsoni]